MLITKLANTLYMFFQMGQLPDFWISGKTPILHSLKQFLWGYELFCMAKTLAKALLVNHSCHEMYCNTFIQEFKRLTTLELKKR